MTMAEVDAGLATALKAAKSKKMFFAFIPKGGGDGKLIVSKAKIPAKEIAEAKKALGGGNAVTGKCFGAIGEMVFLVAKEAPATMEAAVKKVAKRDSGLAVIPTFQVAGDADADEEGGSAPSAAAAGAAPSAGATPPAPAAAAPSAPAAGAAPPTADTAAAGAAPKGQANVLGIQKALQKLGYDPGKIDGITGPHTKAAIEKFQQASGLKADGIVGPKTQAALAKALQGAVPAAPAGGAAPAASPPAASPPAASPPAASADAKTLPGAAPSPAVDLGPWTAARQEAIKDLKALAAKVAGTKHGDAVGVLKEINSIITKLPANPAQHELEKLEHFVANDDTIKAAHDVPAHFHKMDFRTPLLAALKALKKK
jgi:peptidoglycan hydrolase-like protein with peptidoglycan-binding domain